MFLPTWFLTWPGPDQREAVTTPILLPAACLGTDVPGCPPETPRFALRSTSFASEMLVITPQPLNSPQGGWNNNARNTRASNRNNNEPGNRNNNIGFRCVRPFGQGSETGEIRKASGRVGYGCPMGAVVCFPAADRTPACGRQTGARLVAAPAGA